MRSLFVVVAVVFQACCNGQVFNPGGCPKVETISDFDVTKYVGLWYENRKYPAIFEIGGKCITARYALKSNDSITVENGQKNTLINIGESISGTATFEGNSKDGKLVVTFTTVPFPANYWILDTDYNNYSVVWSCRDAFLLNGQFAWILTRERNPPQELIDKALAVLERNNIATQPLTETDQSNCE